MRLGQLARKLEVRPTEVAKYLSDEFDTEIAVHPNTKVEDEMIVKIEAHFSSMDKGEETAMAAVVDVEAVPAKAEVAETPKPKAAKPKVVKAKKDEAKAEEAAQDTSASNDDPENEAFAVAVEQGVDVPADMIDKAEVIKAGGAKLEGFKLVDKIELPHTSGPSDMIEVDGVMMERSELRKKKEAKKRAPRTGVGPASTEFSKPVRVQRGQTDDKDYQSEKQKQRENKEYAERMRKEEAAQKKRQKQHYQQNHKVKTSAKKKKAVVKEKQVEEVTMDSFFDEEVVAEPTAPRKGAFGRLWDWLTQG